MALFSIARYMGDDDPEKSQSSSELLEKLHNKAKQKRQSLSSAQQEDESLPSISPAADADIAETLSQSKESLPKIKKRKSKPIDEADSPSVKRKKHMKLKQIHSSDLGKETGNEDSMDKSFHDSDDVDKSDDAIEELLSDGEDVSCDEDEDREGEDVAKQQQSHKVIGGFTVIGHVKNKVKEKVERVLPDWLAKPSVITADIRKNRVSFSDIPQLDLLLINKLKENGITDFFPVQGQVIPAILGSVDPSNTASLGTAGYRPCDICCSAPTGSGKTLAYVLPLIQCLRRRVVCRLRALIILPVIDLAAQVYKVFQTYCTDTELKVGLAVGQKTFLQEQHMLVRKCYSGYESGVDILVASPSRFVDHLTKTDGLDLTHLRFLVIDEADRMMEEIKHNWLSHVETAVYRETSHNTRPHPTKLNVNSTSRMEIPLQKLLFSATLSQNPEKLEQMRLFHPRLFTAVVDRANVGNKHGDETVTTEEKTDDSVGPKTYPVSSPVRGEFVGKFTTPSGLTEYFVESSVGEKPLVVLHFLHTLKFRRILCFTNSVEATHRLYWLVKLVGGTEVREFSSSLHPDKRTKLLKKFAAGKIDMLICSDAMARGMDVDNVQCVISYEMPQYLKTYIHRVGRTARAGRAGTAISLLEKKQIAHFKRMLKEAGKSGVKEMKLRNSLLKPYVKPYQQALKEMPDVLKAERKKQKQR